MRIDEAWEGRRGRTIESFVDPIVEIAKEIAQIDPDRLTPIAALGLVQEWKKKFGTNRSNASRCA